MSRALARIRARPHEDFVMSSRTQRRFSARSSGPFRSPWTHVAQAAAALAAGMGVGRFVYTPILPLMHTQAGLSSAAGANLATANYVGYLVGALLGIALPALVRSPAVLRGSLIVLTGSLVGMPATHRTTVWIVLRLLVSLSSALIFVVAVSSVLSHLRDHPAHLPGWAFGGVGAGIALSGLLVLVLRSVADWRAAWWASAGLAAVFAAVSWNLRPEGTPASGVSSTTGPAHRPGPRTHRWFTALFAAYTLEGIGYIVSRHVPGRRDRAELPGLGRQRRLGARRSGCRTVLGAVGLAGGAGPAPTCCAPPSSSRRSASPSPR